MKTKSTITSEENSTYVENNGSVKSNDYGVAIELSSGLPSAMERTMETAYEVHRRR